jgi:hypothetical protein
MTDLSKILLYENFEGKSGSIEELPYFRAADNTTIVDGNGGKVGQTWIDRGAEGYGDWGFYWNHPDLQKCEKGDEIWFRMQTYYPDDFEIDSTPGQLKGFRIGRVKKSNDENRGYVDWYIHNDNDNHWKHVVEFEDRPPSTPDTGWMKYPKGDLEKGKWQLYEVYCYLHPTNGVMRMWCDGELMGEQTRPTIAGPEAESRVSRVLYHTYYNGGAPKKQGSWFDHVTVAIKNRVRDDSGHLSTDANGNKFIGTDIEGGVIEPPAPPVDPVDPPVDPVDPVDPVAPPMPPVVDPDPGEPVATMQVTEKRVYVTTSLPVTVIPSE